MPDPTCTHGSAMLLLPANAPRDGLEDLFLIPAHEELLEWELALSLLRDRLDEIPLPKVVRDAIFPATNQRPEGVDPMSKRALGLMKNRLEAIGGAAKFWDLHKFLFAQDYIGIDSAQGAVKRGVRAGVFEVEKPKKNDCRTWTVRLATQLGDAT